MLNSSNFENRYSRSNIVCKLYRLPNTYTWTKHYFISAWVTFHLNNNCCQWHRQLACKTLTAKKTTCKRTTWVEGRPAILYSNVSSRKRPHLELITILSISIKEYHIVPYATTKYTALLTPKQTFTHTPTSFTNLMPQARMIFSYQISTFMWIH